MHNKIEIRTSSNFLFSSFLIDQIGLQLDVCNCHVNDLRLEMFQTWV